MAAQVTRIPSAPHTPSQEWANDATLSLNRTSNAVPDTKPDGSALDSTPSMSRANANSSGRELPGGFGSTTSGTGFQDLSNAFASVGETAMNLAPAGLKNAVSSTTGSSKRGPIGGVGDLPGTPNESGVALSPLERQIANREKGFTRVHGVGNLPGNDSETSVAKLPEERAHEGAFTTPNTQTVGAAATGIFTTIAGAAANVGNQIQGTIANLTRSSDPQTTVTPHQPSGGGVGDLPGTPGETSVVKLPLEREIEANKGVTPVRGVGDLPGHPQEPGVAVLPLEKESRGLLGPHVDGVGDLPGRPSETSVAKLPAERELGQKSMAEHVTNPVEHAKHAVQETVERVKPQGHEKPGEHESTPSEPQAPTEKGHDRRASTSSSGSGSKSKLKLMDKVKGEMKVLTGKVTKNEAKVEHGKAILAGEMSAKYSI